MIHLGGITIFKKSDTEFVIMFAYNVSKYEQRGQLYIKKSGESDTDCILRGINELSQIVLKNQDKEDKSFFFGIPNFFSKFKRGLK